MLGCQRVLYIWPLCGNALVCPTVNARRFYSPRGECCHSTFNLSPMWYGIYICLFLDFLVYRMIYHAHTLLSIQREMYVSFVFLTQQAARLHIRTHYTGMKNWSDIKINTCMYLCLITQHTLTGPSLITGLCPNFLSFSMQGTSHKCTYKWFIV